MMNQIPTVNEQGRELEKLGYVMKGKKAYNQTNGNCFEIASFLAEKFGFELPSSRKELTDMIFARRSMTLWGDYGQHDYPSKYQASSPACLLIRTPDNVQGTHVALELSNREYNYGPGSRENLPIEMRIFLPRKNS
jgi:hypothetical protein